MAKLYVGTSGFSYPQWKPGFYPQNLPAARFLDHYATRLNTVEVNYTYRTIPAAKTLEGWVKKTPSSFIFCPKANMRITHILKLRNAEDMTRVFLGSLEPFRTANQLGPILFQLPPGHPFDLGTLTAFLEMLPKAYQYTFEFRNRSWFNEQVYAELRKHNASLCIAEADTLETPEVITADFVYYRLRKSEFSQEDLIAMAAKVKALIEQDKSAYVFFKHEDTPEGALNAEKLLAIP